MALSSLGPWALGGIMNTLGPGSVWYRMAIYFYLHFQYNGWMVLGLLGLFLYMLEQNQIKIPEIKFRTFFWSFNAGIVLTFFLSTLWAGPPAIFYLLGGSGALLQLFGLLVLISACRATPTKNIFSRFQWFLTIMVLFLLTVKMLLQLLTALPYFANLAATILDFTIGYLHWTFLGVISIAIFLFLDYFKLMKIGKTAFAMYCLGFLITEILIFYRGMVVWQGWAIFQGYSIFLAIVSFLIVLAIGGMFFGTKKVLSP